MIRASIKLSQKIYELVGKYETDERVRAECSCCVEAGYPSCGPFIPSPNFGELIRILPKIGEKKGWLEVTFCLGDVSARTVAEEITWLYMNAPTESEGMQEVEKYLLPLL